LAERSENRKSYVMRERLSISQFSILISDANTPSIQSPCIRQDAFLVVVNLPDFDQTFDCHHNSRNVTFG
jgi:hypothetical protein